MFQCAAGGVLLALAAQPHLLAARVSQQGFQHSLPQLGQPGPGHGTHPERRRVVPQRFQIGLGLHQQRSFRRIFGGLTRRGTVFEVQHQIGSLSQPPRLPHPRCLDLITGVTQACRIDQHNGQAAQLQPGFQVIAGGSRNGRHDAALVTHQRVEQARFSGVRPPDQGQPCTLGCQASGPPAGDQGAKLGLGGPQRLDAFLFGHALVGVVEHGLERAERARDQPLHLADAPRERPRQPQRGLPAGSFGLCAHQIQHRLGLSQVHAPAQVGPQGKLAGASRSRPGVQGRRQHFGQHRRAAVRLHLGHVFAGVAVPRTEDQTQPLVEHLAAYVHELTVQKPPARRSTR